MPDQRKERSVCGSWHAVQVANTPDMFSPPNANALPWPPWPCLIWLLSTPPAVCCTTLLLLQPHWNAFSDLKSMFFSTPRDFPPAVPSSWKPIPLTLKWLALSSFRSQMSLLPRGLPHVLQLK